jgi:hypothetical protein
MNENGEKDGGPGGELGRTKRRVGDMWTYTKTKPSTTNMPNVIWAIVVVAVLAATGLVLASIALAKHTSNGTRGHDGATGVAGAKGDRGEAGPSGASLFTVGTFSATTTPWVADLPPTTVRVHENVDTVNGTRAVTVDLQGFVRVITAGTKTDFGVIRGVTLPIGTAEGTINNTNNTSNGGNVCWLESNGNLYTQTMDVNADPTFVHFSVVYEVAYKPLPN